MAPKNTYILTRSASHWCSFVHIYNDLVDGDTFAASQMTSPLRPRLGTRTVTLPRLLQESASSRSTILILSPATAARGKVLEVLSEGMHVEMSTGVVLFFNCPRIERVIGPKGSHEQRHCRKPTKAGGRRFKFAYLRW